MRDCVIFGAGIFGKQARDLLNSQYRILAYMDNDPKKQGTSRDGLEICPPSELDRFPGCDVVVAARVPYPIVAQIRSAVWKTEHPVYIFDPRQEKPGQYLLYRVEKGDICVPEYMDSRYTVDQTLRCHYSELPKNVLRLFQTALGWIREEFPTDAKIVELGCGSGQFANMLLDSGYTNYTGYDFSQAAITRAAELNPAWRERFFRRDIRGMTWPGRPDAVIIFEVLEHLADDIAVVEALPGGTVVLFTVPSFDSFNHVRKFENLAAILERYGDHFDFSRYQRIDTGNHKCWFLLQGEKI